jgi:hypothetical protein
MTIKYLLLVASLALVAACKPEVSLDIYAGDILEVAETGKSLEIPVRMGLPIQDEKKCDENKNKMLPALQKYGKGVKFVSCKDLEGKMHDLLIVEMIGEIVKAPESGAAAIQGMFGMSVSQSNDGSLIVYFIKTDKVDKAVLEIDKNYQFQDVEIDDIALTLRLNNDLRKTIKFEIEGSFLDNNPVDAPTVFELPRRGVKEIVPSNVRSQSIIKTGKARFIRLLVN